MFWTNFESLRGAFPTVAKQKEKLGNIIPTFSMDSNKLQHRMKLYVIRMAICKLTNMDHDPNISGRYKFVMTMEMFDRFH